MSAELSLHANVNRRPNVTGTEFLLLCFLTSNQFKQAAVDYPMHLIATYNIEYIYTIENRGRESVSGYMTQTSIL